MSTSATLKCSQEKNDPALKGITKAKVQTPFYAYILLMMLFEVLITDVMVICGTSEYENTSLRRVRW